MTASDIQPNLEHASIVVGAVSGVLAAMRWKLSPPVFEMKE